MSDEQPRKKSEADEELEREIRKGRKFTLSEAIGRLAGPGAMKGVSPISGKQQGESAVEGYLKRHLPDAGGALRGVLFMRVRESDLLLMNYERPLVVLAAFVQRVLDSEFRLQELVREADVEWGRIFDERPHFEREGCSPHQDDPYTVDSVRRTLEGLLEKLAADEPG
jgi:hypothetical protein